MRDGQRYGCRITATNGIAPGRWTGPGTVTTELQVSMIRGAAVNGQVRVGWPVECHHGFADRAQPRDPPDGAAADFCVPAKRFWTTRPTVRAAVSSGPLSPSWFVGRLVYAISELTQDRERGHAIWG
jgi:hypothetical protein